MGKSSGPLLPGAPGSDGRARWLAGYGVRPRVALAALVGAAGCLVLVAAVWTGFRGGRSDAQELVSVNTRGDAEPNPRFKSMADVNSVVNAANQWMRRREAALQASGSGAPKTALRAKTLKLSEGDMDEFLVSDFFEFLSRNCCRSLYFPKEAQQALPQGLPGGVNGEYAQRLRDFVGMRNELVFVGADANTASFVNKYFGLHLEPTPVTSGYQMRKSYEIAGDPSSPLAYPEVLEEELPLKLQPGQGMTAFDTATLPAATAVVYNNFPRSPTGSPLFIMKFCQIENPYVQDGTRITVSPPDCAAAAKDLGSECSCGKIAFVGWNWEKAAENIGEMSSINAQALAEYMGAGGRLSSEMKANPSSSSSASLATTKTPTAASHYASSIGSVRGPGKGDTEIKGDTKMGNGAVADSEESDAMNTLREAMADARQKTPGHREAVARRDMQMQSDSQIKGGKQMKATKRERERERERERDGARAPATGAGVLPLDKREEYKPLSRTDRYAMNIAGKTYRLAFAGRRDSDKVPATVVDREPQGPPTWGIDSENRDVIPEWEKQDAKYSFWGREGGWRNICGPRQHPIWDPEQKKFYYEKVGQATNYIKHWCTCMPSGKIEIQTKQGADTLGCEDMYPAGSNIKSVSVAPYSGDERRTGRWNDVYMTTAPGYKYQAQILKSNLC
jgi:hypothetical protein